MPRLGAFVLSNYFAVIYVPCISQAELIALQAEIAAASAKYDYQIDRVQLEYECGTLPYRTPGKVYRGVPPIGHR